MTELWTMLRLRHCHKAMALNSTSLAKIGTVKARFHCEASVGRISLFFVY